MKKGLVSPPITLDDFLKLSPSEQGEVVDAIVRNAISTEFSPSDEAMFSIMAVADTVFQPVDEQEREIFTIALTSIFILGYQQAMGAVISEENFIEKADSLENMMKKRGIYSVQNFWENFYSFPNGRCMLCGDKGFIDIIDTNARENKPVEGRFLCFCPNGRSLGVEAGGS